MKVVKVGIIGLGRLGKEHAKNLAFHVPNCELYLCMQCGRSRVRFCSRSTWRDQIVS